MGVYPVDTIDPSKPLNAFSHRFVWPVNPRIRHWRLPQASLSLQIKAECLLRRPSFRNLLFGGPAEGPQILRPSAMMTAIGMKKPNAATVIIKAPSSP